jgi:hypothetical protein
MLIPYHLGWASGPHTAAEQQWSELTYETPDGLTWTLVDHSEKTFSTTLSSGKHLLVYFGLSTPKVGRGGANGGDLAYDLDGEYHGVYWDTQSIPVGDLRDHLETLISYLEPLADKIINGHLYLQNR